MIVMPIAEEIEDRQALPIDDDRLPIDNTLAHRQCGQSRGDLRETGSEIITVPGEQPDTVVLAPSENAKAVVLNLVDPA